MRFVGIDPSTKTGFVALDEDGQVLRAKELTGIGHVDPLRMMTLIDEVIDHIKKDDFICIEGFGFASQQAIQLGGIGWGIRIALARRKMKWYEVAPGQLKKFGSGKGNTKKDDLAVEIYKRWQFQHSSDNVRDAYVLAKLAQAIWDFTETGNFNYPEFQLEVIKTILNPSKKRKKRGG